MDSKHVRIAYIGGGSRGWALDLFRDLALSGTLHGEIVLHDIDIPAAEANLPIAEKIFSHPDARSHFDVSVEPELEPSLEGADIVVISIEPGPIEARHADLVIPEKYGILQTVGDTTGPGGILRAVRSTPAFVAFARAIRRACPDAWVVNYSNPMTLCTDLLYRTFPDIKAIGCCHEAFGLQTWFQRRVPQWYGVDKPPRNAIRLDLFGVNHFTWSLGAIWQGHDLMPFVAEEINRRGFFDSLDASDTAELDYEAEIRPNRFVGLDFYRRFGVLGAAGCTHLVEFVPWYCGSEESIKRMGARRKDYEWRLNNHRAKLERVAVDDETPLVKSCEEGVETMAALMGGEEFFTNVNLPNSGQIPWLPRGAVVESNAVFRADEALPVMTGTPPLPVQSLIRRVVDVQMAVGDALVAQDPDAVFAALLCDPLVCKLRPDQAKRMWNEMRADNADHLPEWARI